MRCDKETRHNREWAKDDSIVVTLTKDVNGKIKRKNWNPTNGIGTQKEYTLRTSVAYKMIINST